MIPAQSDRDEELRRPDNVRSRRQHVEAAGGYVRYRARVYAKATDESLRHFARRGEIAAVYDTDAFFCFHTINAFEEDGDIQLDLLWYKNADAVNALYRKTMVEQLYDGQGLPKRFTLADVAGAVEVFAADAKHVVPAGMRTEVDIDMELPRISLQFKIKVGSRYMRMVPCMYHVCTGPLANFA